MKRGKYLYLISNLLVKDRKFRISRIWSNKILKKYSFDFDGSVVNVSAGDDLDKEGSSYKDYFPRCSKYSKTNFGKGKYRGFRKGDDYLLNLEEKDPEILKNNINFDLVICHTVLEHVFDFKTAIGNLVELTNRELIIIVPFSQIMHVTEGYDDFWRFTPNALSKLLNNLGMETAICTWNNDFNAAIYVYIHACKDKKDKDRIIKKYSLKGNEIPGHKIGYSFKERIKKIIKILKF